MSSLAQVLSVLKEGTEIAQATVEGEVLIGRSEHCGLRLDDRAISREHALIRVIPDGFEIVRKSLFAPLLINGREITQAVAKPGDWLELGPFRVQLGGPQRAAIQEVADALPVAPLEFEVAPEAPESALVLPDPPQTENLELNAVDATPVPEQTPEIPAVPEVPVVPEVAEVPTQGSPDPDGATRVFGNEQVRAILEFQEGAANVREIEIRDTEIVIGRGKACQVILQDKKASRRHAGVSRQGSQCVIRDLGSSNGFMVNGERVREHFLSGEDIIKIGDTEFTFKAVHLDYELRKNEFLNPDELPVEEAAPMAIEPLAAAVPQMSGAGPTPLSGPGQAWIPGMQAPAVEEKGIAGLLAKWKALPPRKRLLYLGAIGAAVFMLMDEEETPAPPTPATKQQAPARSTAAADPQAEAKANQEKLFEQLTPEQKKYVETQYVLAQQLFEAKDYERTHEELSKIFQLLPNYKFARDYERYAKEGMLRIKREAEDRRRREEEERVLAKVKELEADAERLAKDQQWDAMKVVLDDIQALDPENAKVAQWKSEMADALERERQAKELLELQKALNTKAQAMLREGDRLQQAERYLAAISTYKRIEPSTPDKRIYRRALKRMADARAALNTKVQPLLAEAQAREAEGSGAKAYKLYRQVLEVLPSSKEARAGVERLRGQISERAKYVYAEAVLAESYSDFDLAAKKYQECLEIAPEDNMYYQRAKRRLARYRPFTDPSATGASGGSGS